MFCKGGEIMLFIREDIPSKFQSLEEKKKKKTFVCRKQPP